jgi:two-component system sensor histidine kinase YesM
MVPVKQLSSAMHETEGGNLDIVIYNNREDEFGILYEDFNEMTLRIKTFTEQRVQNEKDLNTANIAMMHAQLNPHFLYNTLDTIKWSAKMHHIPQISTMATSLAKIMRMSISTNRFIYLEDEISIVKSYMEIQKIRFDNRFTYKCTLPNELSKVKIPKLIIQPIVENAVMHGLLDMNEGNISVKCFVADEELFIEVIDNGCGINDDVLKNLNSKGENKLKNHIGFYNVNKIIRLSYGEEFGLNAERIKEGGTRVVLRMPIVKGENNV